MTMVSLPNILFGVRGENEFLIPDKKWSDVNGKKFDLEESDA